VIIGQAEGDAPDEIAEIKNVKISLTLHAVADMLTGLTVSSLTNSLIQVFTSLGPVIDTFRLVGSPEHLNRHNRLRARLALGWMAMQQYLIPHRIGDQRLLIPGWAGELSDPEVEFIQERLRLSRKWGIINRGYSEQGIRQVALSGITEQTKKG